MPEDPPIERIPTFVQDLDPRMEGGIPRGSVVIIEGGAGCMKSTLAYSILHNNVQRFQRRGLYITIEQPTSDIQVQMAHLGMSPKATPEIAERLKFLDLGQVRNTLASLGESEKDADWFASILAQVKAFHAKQPIDLVVLDSLNGVFALLDETEPRLPLFHFVVGLKELGVTTLLVHEVSEGARSGESVAGFLGDGIINIERKRVEETVVLQLAITKMRKTAHDHSYFPFLARRGKLEVVAR
jgi:KaiC/GvpD/RAD55 family RecA-like ATPase